MHPFSVIAFAFAGRGGLIVNVSSIASVVSGAFDWVHYGASKAAVDTFTKGLALETAAKGSAATPFVPAW